MISLALDKLTNDIYFEKGELQLIKDVQNDPKQIEQNLKTRLLFFREEWFLDTSVGLPYFSDIMVKTPNIPNISAIIKSEILKVTGVKSIEMFDLFYDIPKRKLTVNFTVSTIYGSATLTENL
jgi:hypothetical protein